MNGSNTRCLASYRMQQLETPIRVIMQRKDRQSFAWDEALALEQSFNLALMTMDVQRQQNSIAARVYRGTESIDVKQITQEIWLRTEHSFNRSRQELLNEYEVFFRS